MVDIRRIAFRLEYEGTHYCGFQLQNDQPTIQKLTENAFYSLYRENIRVAASGRTDSGVHARGQIVHADVPRNLPAENVAKALNSYLPRDIRVTALAYVKDDFHARFDAVSRLYRYTIFRGITALEKSYVWQIYQKIETDVMIDCASYIIGEHDFTSFCLSQTETENKICRITRAEWIEDGLKLYFYIEADRFLHSMVRALVGTMVDAGKSRYSVKDFKDILSKHEHGAGAFTAPPHGLVLEEVKYYPQIIWQWTGDSV
jgi:tRNA pseudouridine38-40 synthase